MKLTIIPLVDPTDQQYLDLYKIWPDQSRNQIKTLLFSGQKFYAARFNDRLLGAAKIQIDQYQGTIYDFLVRDVTRRRGVGLYLLDEIFHQQPQVTHWFFSLRGVSEEERPVLVMFLLACGFTTTQDSNKWEKKA
ncbi:aspartate 1-decarboxylase autocleavage activator PanM [Providencia burhodogranariea]|uniref:PanD regulatory factor n=1 Tax=Providencia burhodogranariea DSM 19968 TaxID=1141662 RepID=K8WHZ5_9GAMM|nr:aspartate 1-decarboxylase autocleavage activator PanM [Providencia burhodogranariea]EKT59576.1 acetyltransferase [Providencia burhodogranariea DSM 19968]